VTVPPREHVPPTTAPPLPKPVVLQQSWRDVLFIHWPLEPETVTHLFPPGTRPDTLDGRTYVGVVGFTIPSNVIGGTVNVGATYEVNVRLYSVDDTGRQGVVFLSMDVTRPDMVVAARSLPGLPYMWSHVEPIRTAPAVAGFEVQRRLPSQLRARVEIEVSHPVPHPTPLEVFLTARWGLHTRALWGLTWIPVGHDFWSLHQAELRHADDALLTAAGVPAPTQGPVSVLWSPGLDAQIGRPQRVTTPTTSR
jgi:uncharacterized protein YqjF (DUF2071 family)